MHFQLPTVTQVEFTNVNVRPEFHGEDRIHAADISCRIKGGNDLLDLIKPGLREHHFCDKASAPGQQPLQLLALPNVRHPELPKKFSFAKGERWRGYHFVLDFGLGGASNLDFQDSVLANLVYEFAEGGSTQLDFVIQYNGEELADETIYGRTAGLATLGKGHIKLIAPSTVTLVKGDNWRSGKPDAKTPPPASDGGAPLFKQTGDGSDDADVVHPPGSPEAALAGTQEPDPFASDPPVRGSRRRANGAAA